MPKNPYVIYGAIAVVALIIGAGYGDRIPLVTALARKLPGSRA